MSWRKWNHLLHRDIGFVCVGLTLLYAVSGVALNHRRDWNPSYRIETVQTQVAPRAAGVVEAGAVRGILAELGESRHQERFFQPDAENLWIFVEGRMARIHLPSGSAEFERVARRTFWFPLNALHLNQPRGAWTWVTDLYAALLALVTLSGLLMLRRRTLRRALLLTSAGLLVPLVFAFFFLE